MDYGCECGNEVGGYDENYVVMCRCGKPMEPLMKKTESVAEVPCSDRVSRAGVNKEHYIVMMSSGAAYFQRGTLTSATENPLGAQEKIIAELCEIILGKPD